MSQEKQGLTQKVLSGLFWTAGGKGAQAVLQFVVMAILARLMSPLEFGIVGAAMIIVGFSDILTRLGLGPALVQRSELKPAHLGTALFVSLIFSSLTGALIWIFAPTAAGFFNYEGVETVLRALAWLFPIRGCGVVADSLAQREMRFKWLASRDALCLFVGYFGVGVGLALAGFGVWALVAASLVTASIRTIALLIEYPPKHFLPQRRAFQELVYFGGGFTLARIANYLALQGDNLVVGRMLGLPALGLYGRAYQLMSAPASLFGQVLDDVLFPSMSKMQHEKERLAKAYLRGVSLIALVMLPASVVSIIIAPELVRFLLGAKWMEVVLPFRILTLGLILRTSYKMSDSLARATGSVYRRAWRQAVYAASVIGGAWIGQFWGIAGVAAGVLASLIINFTLMAQMSLNVVGISTRTFLKVHEKAFLLSMTTALVTLPTVVFLRQANAPPFLLLIVTGFVLFVYFSLIIVFAPHRFLGEEGMWMLYVLKNYVPDKYADKFAFIKENRERKPAVVSDGSAENNGVSG